MSIFRKLFGGSRKPNIPTQPQQQNINHYNGLIQLNVADGKAINWNQTDRLVNQNIAITGTMGSGKTQLIKAWLLDTVAVKKRIIIDYKADYTDLGYVVTDLKREPLPFNPMLPNSFDAKPIRDIKYRLATIIQSYSAEMGGKQIGAFRSAVEEYLNMKENQVITDDSLYVDEVPNFSEFIKFASVKQFIGEEYLQLLDGAFVSKVLEPLAEFDIFPKSSVTFEDFMTNGETDVIVVKNMYSNSMKNLVSHVIIEHLYPYMLANQKGKLFNGKFREQQCLLLIDEAKTIMGDKVESLISILKEGREFGYSVWFGTQYLEDFNQKRGYKYLKYFPSRLNGKNNDEGHKHLKPHHFEVDGEELFITPYWQRAK